MTSNKSKVRAGFLMLASLLIAAESHAEGAKVAASELASDSTATATEHKIAESLKKLTFVPHASGSPAVTDAGGVRAVSILSKVELLAPKRPAHTLSPSPTLYWYVSKPVADGLGFTLYADGQATAETIVEIPIDDIDQEGVYGVDLGDYDITLEDGQRYAWSVTSSSVEDDLLQAEPIVHSVLEHRTSAALIGALEDASADQRAVRLAAEGYWYDALKALTEQIDGDAPEYWHQARSHLLEQAGALQAARFDRMRAGN